MSARNKRNNKKKNNVRRGATNKFSGAPVAVSEDIQQYTVFLLSRRGTRGIRMKTCAAIATVLRTSSTVGANNGLIMKDNQRFKCAQLNLTDPIRLDEAGGIAQDAYLSPVFDLIASAFTRYEVKSLKFHYEPQSSATTTERLVFAFAPDPLHPIIYDQSSTVDTLLAVSDSVAFAPWRTWTIDVTDKMDKTLYYTYSDPSVAGGTFSDRFSDFGSIACVTSDTATATNTSCGVLYMEIDVELVEFCPIINVNPEAAKGLSLKLRPRAEKAKMKQYCCSKLLRSKYCPYCGSTGETTVVSSSVAPPS